jgi:HD superfamily phosphodiesterase
MNFTGVKKFILQKLKDDLPTHLSYHSIFHVKDVLQAATTLGKSEKLNSSDLTLLKTAALFHDSGFLFGPKDHELKSCDIARKYLPEFGYDDTQIDKICGMIMATRIPQTPKNHLEEILADADLDYLGRDDFFEISNFLFGEMKFFGVIHDEDDWNRIQVKFFEAHHYFTDTAIMNRKPQKEKYLEIIKEKLNH